jgi:tetratricopeptide (TPR) repeat protein
MIGIAALSLCATAVSSRAASTDDPALPPGHPKVDPPSSRRQFGTGELPPDHPKIDGTGSDFAGQSQGAELPPDHPQVRPGRPAPSADQILQQLDSTPQLKQREKTFEIASAVGKLYYAHARYADAAEYLGQADKKAEPARAMYLEQRKRAGALGPGREAGCGSLDQNTMDARTAAARQLASKGNAGAAAECARAALEPALEIEELRGNALFLSGDSVGALASYQRALAIFADRPNALYGRASVLFDSKGDDVKALRQARDDWSRFVRLEPDDARAPYVRKLIARTDAAISAGGLTKLARKSDAESKPTAADRQVPPANQQLPPLSPEVIESIKNTERTPELEEGLAKLVEEGEEHLAHQRYQEALDAYKRVVPFQPENGRAKAGMAWALVGLQRQPMADRVWSVAVEADPAAMEKLGDALAAKGDKAGAKALWKKLSESSPSYAQRSELSAKLK